VQDLWPIVAIACLVAILVVQSVRLSRARALAREGAVLGARELGRQVAARARSVRAVEGEGDASLLLERAGYSVVDRQVAGSWTLFADGEPVTFGLRADYLVARDGRQYIAEVKTGLLATRLSHANTRRQLLEYRLAFDVDGVILVDADAGTVTHIEIASEETSSGVSRGNVVWIVLASVAMGVLVGHYVAW